MSTGPDIATFAQAAIWRLTRVMGKKPLRKGEQVTWRSHGQTVHGKVAEKITERTDEAGRTVAASAEDPQYRVTSDRSGRDAVHKPEALRRER